MNVDKGKYRTKQFEDLYKQRRIGSNRAERMLYCQYRTSAKNRRNLEFTLDEDLFYSMLHKPCSICNRVDVNTISYNKKTMFLNYNGIDRINNTLGYLPDNIQTMCGDCNKAKTSLGVERFNNWIQAIKENNHD